MFGYWQDEKKLWFIQHWIWSNWTLFHHSFMHTARKKLKILQLLVVGSNWSGKLAPEPHSWVQFFSCPVRWTPIPRLLSWVETGLNYVCKYRNIHKYTPCPPPNPGGVIPMGDRLRSPAPPSPGPPTPAPMSPNAFVAGSPLRFSSSGFAEPSNGELERPPAVPTPGTDGEGLLLCPLGCTKITLSPLAAAWRRLRTEFRSVRSENFLSKIRKRNHKLRTQFGKNMLQNRCFQKRCTFFQNALWVLNTYSIVKK